MNIGIEMNLSKVLRLFRAKLKNETWYSCLIQDFEMIFNTIHQLVSSKECLHCPILHSSVHFHYNFKKMARGQYARK